MAQDDTDRVDEREAERNAEIVEEMERIGRDPDEVDEGDDDLGTQNAPRSDEQADDLDEAEAEATDEAASSGADEAESTEDAA